MKQLDIAISKARLCNITVEFPEDALALPNVTATIGLMAANGKQIATYALQTNPWNKNLKFDLPDSMLPHLGRVRDEIEQVIVAHCMGSFQQLPPAAEVVEDVADGDVPF